MRILGIETSCDETAVAIVVNGTTVVSSTIASSMDIHAKYGGVIPEIAARSHIESITAVIDEALDKFTFTPVNITNTPAPAANDQRLVANSDPWDMIDGIAVTNGAGLSGSLLIGVLAARTLAIIKNKPLYAINHVEAHVYANFLNTPAPQFPILSLIVSGGHSQLVLFKDHFNYQLLGQTCDDAVGEAFDKVAKILGLPYPGGPSVAKAAELGDPLAYDLPIAKVEGKYNFSFSGLKTAVLRATQTAVGGDFRTPSTDLPALLTNQQKNDMAASFQRVAVQTLADKTLRAYQEFKPKSVVIAGGVAANQALRQKLTDLIPKPITYAPLNLCTDNGAMVASLGCFKAMRGIQPDDPYTLGINPNLKM